MSEEKTITFQIQRLSEVLPADLPAILNEVVKVEKETWSAEIQAPREKFISRAEVFPEGFLTISTPDLGLVGVSTAEVINYDPTNPPVSWEEVTDNGWIKKTHTPAGDALYLVSVGASPRPRKMGVVGVGTRLVQEQIKLAQKLKLKYLVLGSRIPGFAEYHLKNPSVSVEDYLKLQKEDSSEESLDPEIRFYKRCGLEVEKIVANYMEDDPESENFGAVMVWENPNLAK